MARAQRHGGWGDRLASESVQSAALAFQSVHYVHGGDGLPLGVLGVGDCVTDHVLQENFENSAGLLVDQTGDTLHAASSGQTTDRRLRDALDVVSQYLAMPFGASLPESLTAFASSSHVGQEIRCRM